MLVLTRNVNETVKIGDDIEVMVIRVNGNQVKLSFKVPPDIAILRGELKANPGQLKRYA